MVWTMFLLRSAFWLTAAYLVLAPHAGTDLSNAAQTVGAQVEQAAPDIATAGISRIACDSAQCAVGRSAALGALAFARENGADTLAEAAIAPRTAPVPPPRPGWAG